MNATKKKKKFLLSWQFHNILFGKENWCIYVFWGEKPRNHRKWCHSFVYTLIRWTRQWRLRIMSDFRFSPTSTHHWSRIEGHIPKRPPSWFCNVRAFPIFAQYDPILDIFISLNTDRSLSLELFNTLHYQSVINNTQASKEATINKSFMLHLLVSIRTFAFRLIIFCTIIVRGIVKGSISSAHRPPSSLVVEMPVETHERFVLITFMLQKRCALLDTKLLQISKKFRIPYQMLCFPAIFQRFPSHLRIMIRFFRLRL